MYPKRAETDNDIRQIFKGWAAAWHQQNEVENMLRDMANEHYLIENGKYTIGDLLEIPKEQLIIEGFQDILNQPSHTCTIDHLIHLFDYDLAEDYSWDIQDFFQSQFKLNGNIVEDIHDELPDFIWENAYGNLEPYPDEEKPGIYYITEYLAHGGPNCSITWVLQHNDGAIKIIDIRMNYNWWSPNKTISIMDEQDAHAIYEHHLEDWTHISIFEQELAK